jgi:adenylate cyclase
VIDGGLNDIVKREFNGKNPLEIAVNHWPFTLAFVLLMGGLALRVSESGLIHRLRNAGFDTMMRLSPREAISPSPIVLLAIDQTALDEQGQWPWSRLKMAELTDTIREAGAGVVVFDINFAQEDRMKAARVQEVLGIELCSGECPDPDLAFAESLSQTAAVLASFSRQKSPSENGYQSTAPNTSTRFPAGYFAVGEDPTFHVPQAPAFTDPLPSFARSSMAFVSGRRRWNFAPCADGNCDRRAGSFGH